MSLWDTIKGWFNIGGVSVKITQVEDPFPREDSVLNVSFMLTTKIPKTVLSLRAEFYREETTREEKDGKTEEKTERTSFGVIDTKNFPHEPDYPFDLAAGQSREFHFVVVDINLDGTLGRLAEKKGMAGALGKAAMFAGKFGSKGEMRYFVEVGADVKGAAFDPSDRVPIRIVPGKSQSRF